MKLVTRVEVICFALLHFSFPSPPHLRLLISTSLFLSHTAEVLVIQCSSQSKLRATERRQYRFEYQPQVLRAKHRQKSRG
ncbi:uncharacterized protein BO66DRAFT_395558 [Aspergillus aculeatinus CBS 121060]|uniref:Uncharacterized protein n=1 Tax=Aspergillus aculeatinus CBS 121060 TaxID=1448322 RepID=A0ACD1GV38_9EURO|nr:hypothetical protein BO66DRAFT_395558 [Aspergillus aculeatinus CBS 121060]RAH65325.1 hypothetical protein BO66DRAFT_395558 [Aspergillus aculeatinus CBS 121060]